VCFKRCSTARTVLDKGLRAWASALLRCGAIMLMGDGIGAAGQLQFCMFLSQDDVYMSLCFEQVLGLTG
jgi:hypothetical protein